MHFSQLNNETSKDTRYRHQFFIPRVHYQNPQISVTIFSLPSRSHDTSIFMYKKRILFFSHRLRKKEEKKIQRGYNHQTFEYICNTLASAYLPFFPPGPLVLILFVCFKSLKRFDDERARACGLLVFRRKYREARQTSAFWVFFRL